MLRAFQWDLARQVERLDVLLGLLPLYAKWGYQELYLHLEDCVHYPSLPGVARAEAYRYDDLIRLTEEAGKVGIGVVPIVNLLGHTQYLIKTEEWRDLNELRAADGTPLPRGQLCPLHPRVPDLVERLLNDTKPFCTAGKVHVGLDESFHLGKCPRCQAEVAEAGLAAHFARHVSRLQGAVARRGLELGLWGDMLALFPEAIEQVSRGTHVYEWFYYPFDHLPRLELHGFRDYDLAPALKEAGARVWGCPMNGAFRWEVLPIFRDRLENARSWYKRCQRINAHGFLVTSWEGYRVSFPVYAVIDAAIASLWLDGPDLSADEMLARGFERAASPLRSRESSRSPFASPRDIATLASLPSGYSEAPRLVPPRAASRRLATLALASDKYPFSGYLEWELNQRWDGGATCLSIQKLRHQASALDRLLADSVRVCKGNQAGAAFAFSASLRLRTVLARRALFVREAAETARALRRALNSSHPRLVQARLVSTAVAKARAFTRDLAEGFEAARLMWLATRHMDQESQNISVLRQDALRLDDWVKWLGRVLKKPEHAFTASPVLGEWQLRFQVETSAPAVQRVSVELLQGEGTWTEVAARHVIEFQAWAAKPDSKLSRPFAVSIPPHAHAVRLVLRGPGMVELTDLSLTDGQRTISITPRICLGEPPLSHGLPDLQAIAGSYEVPLAGRKDTGCIP
ncbi:MAG: family 20 glycosylhydrolase [Opitutaceae bacterium]|nr:family 20 glycosylhydrolase [Opitutaceae bacterium]